MKSINFFLLLILFESIKAQIYNYNQGQLMSYENNNPWGNLQSRDNNIINSHTATPNMNMMTMNGYNYNGEIHRTMTNNMNYGNYAPTFPYNRESNLYGGNNFIDMQKPSLQSNIIIPAEHYYSHNNYDAHSNYNGHSNVMQVKPQIVLYEPKLLNHELQSYVRAIDGSPILHALFSINSVPLPPPLVLLTNFGDHSYHYLNSLDELKNVRDLSLRRSAVEMNRDEYDDENDEMTMTADDDLISIAMKKSFEQNSALFNNFMQQKMLNSPFHNLFSGFTHSTPLTTPILPHQPSFNSHGFYPAFTPPSFPNIFPQQYPLPHFDVYNPELQTPSFNFIKPNSDGYDYTPPSLIQIGNSNTNIKSNSGDSMQRGIIQINNDEVDDDMMNTSTVESSTVTEDYETTTTFDNDDRVDINVIKTLAG
ncbi:hypothetical protein PVAND_000377 [Polypedilum vanderplanki]|uniref:Uncharacterized protein n=1 Tax=Polypedilum vanderplanki TaxID=319348 RepID=A0A9J6BJX0_POLVA|nr:hypothetical protein PVAND_000377 [Polypedilum vanderplanki]